MLHFNWSLVNVILPCRQLFDFKSRTLKQLSNTYKKKNLLVGFWNNSDNILTEKNTKKVLAYSDDILK